MSFTRRSASWDSAAEATTICAASTPSGSFGQVRMISAATSAHRAFAVLDGFSVCQRGKNQQKGRNE
jgi:hypothetical protein